jgi:hypothetical protein
MADTATVSCPFSFCRKGFECRLEKIGDSQGSDLNNMTELPVAEGAHIGRHLVAQEHILELPVAEGAHIGRHLVAQEHILDGSVFRLDTILVGEHFRSPNMIRVGADAAHRRSMRRVAYPRLVRLERDMIGVPDFQTTQYFVLIAMRRILGLGLAEIENLLLDSSRCRLAGPG